MSAQVQVNVAGVDDRPKPRLANWACLALVAFGAPLTLAWISLLGWLLYLACISA